MLEPEYQITNEILKNIGVIEAAKEVINNAPLVPAWEARFKEEARVKTVHYGTHVEGNDLTFEQAQKIVQEKSERDENAMEVARRARVVARDRDVQEVINYRNVLDYIDRKVKESRELEKDGFEYTKRQMLEMHALSVEKIMSVDEVGVFRDKQVVIRGVRKGDIVRRPPNAVEVPYQVEAFFKWLNSEEANKIHPVLRAGIVHYELSRIHPFTEGNGRTARGMVLLLLAIENIDARRFFSIEEHFDKNIVDYYDAFIKVEEAGGEMTEWLEFFSKALAVEMEKVKERIKRISMDSRLRGKMGKQVALKERQIKLIEYLESHEWLRMSEARKILPMVSDDTILRDIKDLMDKDLLKKKGKTKGARYALKSLS